jgi:hypothetical protein
MPGYRAAQGRGSWAVGARFHARIPFPAIGTSEYPVSWPTGSAISEYLLICLRLACTSGEPRCPRSHGIPHNGLARVRWRGEIGRAHGVHRRGRFAFSFRGHQSRRRLYRRRRSGYRGICRRRCRDDTCCECRPRLASFWFGFSVKPRRGVRSGVRRALRRQRPQVRILSGAPTISVV